MRTWLKVSRVGWLAVAGLVLVGVIGAPASGWSTTIPINNYSFESPYVVNTNPHWSTDVVTGWVSLGSSGVFYPVGYALSGFDQQQVAWIQGTGTISQTLNATIQPGTYTLTALEGTWVASNQATYHVQLWDVTKNVLLKETSGTANYNTMANVTVQYVANNSNYFGDTLKIVLSNSGNNSEINYDKLILDYVPLPSTVLLLGSGLVGLGLWRHRRKGQKQ
jgi:hypothetical protein